MMIAFVQGLQHNGTLYGTIGSENKNTAGTYSPVQPRPSSENPSSEKYSFARAVDEARDKSDTNTHGKAEAQEKERVHNKSTHKDDANTAKDIEQQSKKINSYSRDTKILKNERAEDENTLKVSIKRNNDDEIFDDDENALSHVQLQNLHGSQIKHEHTHSERTITQISAGLQNVEDADDAEVKSKEQRAEENLGMFEKQPPDTLTGAERKHHDSASLSMQEKPTRTAGEFEKFLENTHRDIRDNAVSKMHAGTEINAKREEPLSRVTYNDEFMHDEDTQEYSKDQVHLKSDNEKRVHAKSSLEMFMHDDGKEKPQSFETTSQTSLNTIHEKKNYLHKATPSMLGKKGLSYLNQHGNKRLVQDVKLLFRENSTGNIRLQLNPKELGDVKLTVKLDDNNLVHARAIVSSEDAKDVMQKNLGNLAKHFGSEGYEIGSFSVSVNTERSDTNDGTQQFSKRHAQQNENVYAAEVEQNMRSYVRICQSIDFVA